MQHYSKFGPQGNMALEGVGITDHRVRGRPPVHEEEYFRKNIIVTETVDSFLESTVAAIRANGRGRGKGKVNMDASKFIRGFILGLKQAGYRLEDRGIRDEFQLATLIKIVFERAMKAG